MTVEQTGNTGVVLFDGTGVTVTVRVTWQDPPDPTMSICIPASIFDFFHGDPDGFKATLAALIGNTDLQLKLANRVKAGFGAKSVTIIGIQVTSPPVELHSKQVTAILKSGETVRVTFGVPDILARGPTSDEIQRVFALLSASKYGDLANISDVLNKALEEPNRGWKFLVLGLEQVSCACHP